MNKLFPDNPAHDKAAKILATMSPDMVQDIISLTTTAGRDLIPLLFSDDKAASTGITSRPLAIFSRTYIPDEDFDFTWVGFTTIVMAAIRRPTYSNDTYQQILSDAYSLPPEIAEPLAKKIETYDILGNADTGILSSLANSISEGVRKTINWVAEVLQTGWEVDQNQAYDIDFLYELKNLGQVVDDMNSRTRLMSAQAAISLSMGVLQTGDIESTEEGEVDAMVGDVFHRLSLRKLPPMVGGGFKHLMNFGHRASHLKAKKVMEAGGYSITKNGEVRNSGGKHPIIRKILTQISAMKPSQAALIGAGLGLTPLAIELIRKKGHLMGDPQGNLYSVVSTDFGDNVARAWQLGDIENLVGEVLRDSQQEYSTGDPELDDTIAEAIIAQGDNDGTEVGGIIRNIRINHARRQAGRRMRHSGNKQARIGRKQRTRNVINRYKDMPLEQEMTYQQNMEQPDGHSDGEESYMDEGPDNDMMSDNSIDYGLENFD